ncbi:MAG: sporulation integral membrane protein YtvI [Defluviitaleaceae bacterium]|nr:sporulation integral membrane protein YtvI [Defluviitaleaceae bacterium]
MSIDAAVYVILGAIPSGIGAAGPVREFYYRHKKTADKVAFFALITISVYVFFQFLFIYVSPFFIGLIVALAMEPIIRLLVKRLKFKRWLAALACLIFFLLAAGGLGTLIVSAVSRQVRSFVDNAPAFIESLSRTLDDANEFLRELIGRMPESIRFEFGGIQNELASALAAIFGDGVYSQSIRFVSNLSELFINTILTMVSAFFLMKDGPMIFAAIKRVCPEWLRNNFSMMRRGLSRAVGGYFRAQFIMMSIVGAIGIAGLLILRNPYALLLGLIMAVLDFLPIVGSGSVLLPWAVYAFATGQIKVAVGLLILYGVITIARQSIEPKVLGVQIGVHPLAMLLSIYVGFRIFGFAGIIIGPSIVIIGKAIREAERLEPATLN